MDRSDVEALLELARACRPARWRLADPDMPARMDETVVAEVGDYVVVADADLLADVAPAGLDVASLVASCSPPAVEALAVEALTQQARAVELETALAELVSLVDPTVADRMLDAASGLLRALAPHPQLAEVS